MASGKRDEDSTPALAMLVSASTATIEMPTFAGVPRSCSVASAIGVRLDCKRSGGVTPSMTNTTTTYTGILTPQR
jgi:hypothetical protein